MPKRLGLIEIAGVDCVHHGLANQRVRPRQAREVLSDDGSGSAAYRFDETCVYEEFASRRLTSGPLICAMLRPPLTMRLAAVVSLVTTLRTTGGHEAGARRPLCPFPQA